MTHADELPYIFGNPLSNQTIVDGFVSSWTDDDIRVAQQMMTLWTNMAKYGYEIKDFFFETNSSEDEELVTQMVFRECFRTLLALWLDHLSVRKYI